MKKLLLLLVLFLSVPTAQAQTLVSDAFDQPFGPEWVYIQAPDTTKYRIDHRKLRLYGSVSTLTKGEQPTFVGRRQVGSNLLMSVRVDFRESYQGDEAGICIYRDKDHHAEICLEGTREKMLLSFRATQKELTARYAQMEIDDYGVWLQIRSNGEQYFYEYSLDGKDYKTLFKISCSLLGLEPGALCGMYCMKKNATDLTYANFAEFKYKNE